MFDYNFIYPRRIDYIIVMLNKYFLQFEWDCFRNILLCTPVEDPRERKNKEILVLQYAKLYFSHAVNASLRWLNNDRVMYLKLHKIENFFGSDFEFFDQATIGGDTIIPRSLRLS